MSDHISWETCPRCHRPAAVGWIDGHPGEFDCLARCQLKVSEVRQLAARVKERGERPATGAA